MRYDLSSFKTIQSDLYLLAQHMLGAPTRCPVTYKCEHHPRDNNYMLLCTLITESIPLLLQPQRENTSIIWATDTPQYDASRCQLTVLLEELASHATCKARVILQHPNPQERSAAPECSLRSFEQSANRTRRPNIAGWTWRSDQVGICMGLPQQPPNACSNLRFKEQSKLPNSPKALFTNSWSKAKKT